MSAHEDLAREKGAAALRAGSVEPAAFAHLCSVVASMVRNQEADGRLMKAALDAVGKAVGR